MVNIIKGSTKPFVLVFLDVTTDYLNDSDDLLHLIPSSGAAVQPVWGASGGGRHLWIWRQHN